MKRFHSSDAIGKRNYPAHIKQKKPYLLDLACLIIYHWPSCYSPLMAHAPLPIEYLHCSPTAIVILIDYICIR